MSKPTRYAAQQWEMGGLTPSARQLALQIQSLRARVEALEAAQLEQAESHRFCTDAIVRRVEALEAFDHRPLLAAVRAQSKAVAHFGNRLDALEAAQRAIRSGPESPLVERVADAIAGQATSAGIVNDRPARAAIREVAKWLRAGRMLHAAELLEQETDRG
jgi:hypothetical protein